MKHKLAEMPPWISKSLLGLAFLVVFALGYMIKGVVSTPVGTAGPGEQGEPVAQIWTCSMHPEVRLPKPGKCPKCGMDLILAKSEPVITKASGEKKYACSMMCVPPLSKPGKCPICGMDMVEVDEQPGGEDFGARSLSLSPDAQKLAEVRVAPVERKFVEAKIRMVGKLDYDETRLKYITAWVPGRLDRLYVDYTGVPVAEGDHLVYMYSPELLVAQVELLRGIETAKELQGSATEMVRDSAEALVDDAREKLRLWGLTAEQIKEIEQRGKPTDHMTIYAPIGGIVVHKNATEGMYVSTGMRIYTIADLSHLWLKLDAYESDLLWLRYGQKVEFETEAYPGETFYGTISFIDPILTDNTRTVKVRVIVDNADGRLKPQMFARAVARAKLAEDGLIVDTDLAGKWISPMHPEIVKDEPGNCDVCGMPLVRAETLGFVSGKESDSKPPLVIPASAPLITGKRAIVYVEHPNRPGTYQGREIGLGPRGGDYYLVRDGLAEGERVVVNGNFKIDSAIQIQAKPSMMNPEGGGSAPGHAHHGGQAEAPEHAGHESSSHPTSRLDVPPEFSPQLKPVFDTYFRIQSALSSDSLEDAKIAAVDFVKALDAVDMTLLQGPAHHAWMKELEASKGSASTIVTADDINKAREGFALLSESMIVVAREFGTGGESVYRLKCPMAFDNRGADWLQSETPTANPYFGAAMFKCGSLKETIQDSSDASTEGDKSN